MTKFRKKNSEKKIPKKKSKQKFQKKKTKNSGSIFGYDYWGQALPYFWMYYAGGYLRYFPSSQSRVSQNPTIEEAKRIIADLKSLEWLNNGARILLIDLQVCKKILQKIVQKFYKKFFK